MSTHAATMESLYDQQIQKLALLGQKVHVDKVTKGLEKYKEDALKEEFNAAAARTTATQLEVTLAKMKGFHEKQAFQLKELEEKLNTLTFQAAVSKSAADLIDAHKAEIELMKVKPGVLEESIKLLELDLELELLVAEAVAADGKAAAAKKTVDDAAESLEQLKKDYEESKARFHESWPEVTTEVQDNEDTEQLVIELEAAKETIVKQRFEIEVLKAANLDAEEKLSLLGNDTEKKTTSAPSTTEDTASIIKALKDKIEQMDPLYRLGNIVRARKFELDSRKAPSMTNWDLVNAAGNAQNNGQSKADATMVLDFALIKRAQPAQFENTYGVSPSFIWDNRNFSMLINLVDWNMDMKRNRGDKSSFDAGFHKIFSKIHPSLKIASDDALKADAELYPIYRALATIHQEAEKAARLDRKGRH